MNFLKDTYSPFGLEKNGLCYYFKCIIDNDNINHLNIKELILKEENNIENLNSSNLRKLNDNQDLLKFRVKNWKTNLQYDIEYNNNEKYLYTIDKLDNKDKINIRFYFGKKYETNFNGKKYVSLPVYLKKIFIN